MPRAGFARSSRRRESRCAASREHQRLEKSIRALPQELKGVGELIQMKCVSVQAGGIEDTGGHGLDRSADALDVHLRIALVSIDHIEPSPVPQLHVDLSGSVLVVAGDHQTTTYPGQIGCQI